MTCPELLVYKRLNLVEGRMMEAKLWGDDGVREIYRKEAILERGLGYTIVSPGRLTVDAIPLGLGFGGTHQGDSKIGRLSRADVAGICAARLENKSTSDATFE